MLVRDVVYDEVVIGGLGTVSARSAISWSIGSLLIVYALIYDITVGPICYALVSDIPSLELRSKTIVLSRVTYNLLNVVSNTITEPWSLGMGCKGRVLLCWHMHCLPRLHSCADPRDQGGHVRRAECSVYGAYQCLEIR